MKKITIIISMILVICLCTTSFNFNTFAAKNTVKGKISVSLVIPKDMINEFKSALEDSKKTGENYYKDLIANTKDEDKIKQLKKMLEYSQATNIDTMFKNNSDGSATLDIPYGNAELFINGGEIRTDEKGNFEVNNIEDKEYEVTISRENQRIGKQKVKFDKSKNNNDIKMTRTLENLGEGIKRMGNDMEAEGQSITYYTKRAIGSYYGVGVGKSKIFKDTNIVGCNKHDTDYVNDSSTPITTTQFATRNSDCVS